MSQKLSLTSEPGIADRRLEECDLMHTRTRRPQVQHCFCTACVLVNCLVQYVTAVPGGVIASAEMLTMPILIVG